MGFARQYGTDAGKGLQGATAPGRGASRVVLMLAMTLLLAGCGPQNPVRTPVNWWHDLEGGEIAATRPPPPGADLPYPRVFTIPPKPDLPSDAFRQTVQAELTQDRDTTERLAARTPIDLADLPPPPPKPAATTAPPPDTANATLPAAEAPPAKPPAAATPAPAKPSTPVIAATILPDEAALPSIPSAPPPPPNFEQSEAPPAAAPPPVPPTPTLAGSVQVLFASGDATLMPSQVATVRDIAEQRGKGAIAVEGHGEASADTPGAQLAAVELGLRRASSVAAALLQQHVPADKIVLSATAFGRDASVRVQ